MKSQQGVGLLEVLVALVLLAIAVLGFTALQLRAVNASLEAGNNVQALSLARDLAERMRVNRDGLNVYKGGYNSTEVVDTCKTTACDASTLAKYDFSQVYQRASAVGMQVAINDCQGISATRSCIYVSWDDTTPTNGTADTDCTNGETYVRNAKCIILEAYNYDE